MFDHQTFLILGQKKNICDVLVSCSSGEFFMQKLFAHKRNLKRKIIQLENPRLHDCLSSPRVSLSLVRSVVLGLAVVSLNFWGGGGDVSDLSTESIAEKYKNEPLKCFLNKVANGMKAHLCYVHLPSQASSRCLAAKRFCSDEKQNQIIYCLCIFHTSSIS